MQVCPSTLSIKIDFCSNFQTMLNLKECFVILNLVHLSHFQIFQLRCFGHKNSDDGSSIHQSAGKLPWTTVHPPTLSPFISYLQKKCISQTICYTVLDCILIKKFEAVKNKIFITSGNVHFSYCFKDSLLWMLLTMFSLEILM